MLIAGGEEFARGHSSLRVLSLMVPLLLFTAALDFLFVVAGGCIDQRFIALSDSGRVESLEKHTFVVDISDLIAIALPDNDKVAIGVHRNLWLLLRVPDAAKQPDGAKCRGTSFRRAFAARR